IWGSVGANSTGAKAPYSSFRVFMGLKPHASTTGAGAPARAPVPQQRSKDAGGVPFDCASFLRWGKQDEPVVRRNRQTKQIHNPRRPTGKRVGRYDRNGNCEPTAPRLPDKKRRDAEDAERRALQRQRRPTGRRVGHYESRSNRNAKRDPSTD